MEKKKISSDAGEKALGLSLIFNIHPTNGDSTFVFISIPASKRQWRQIKSLNSQGSMCVLAPHSECVVPYADVT